MSTIFKDEVKELSFRLPAWAERKVKKLESLGIEEVISIAYGMLLKTVEEDFITLEEIRDKYNHYLDEFREKFYAVPDFGPNSSLEEQLDLYVQYNYIEQKIEKDGIRYNITDEGKALLDFYLNKKELLKIFRS